MNLDNVEQAKALGEDRQKIIDFRGACQTSANVTVALELAGTVRYANSIIPGEKVRAAMFEEATNQLIDVESRLRKLGVSVAKPEPLVDGTAAEWKREAGMFMHAWQRELSGFIANKRHFIDALVIGTRQLVERYRTLNERHQLPKAFTEWAEKTFGPIARDKRERGLRFLEEALELAQVAGVEREAMEKLLNRVWERPAGDAPKEVGQARACLDMLAYAMGVDAGEEAVKEFARVKAIPQEEWDRRHKAKVDIGVAS